MAAFFIKLKNMCFNKYNVLKISIITVTVICILRNKALLFDPLIIALLTSLYLFPLVYQIGYILITTVTAYLINQNYGIEVLSISILVLAIGAFLKHFFTKNIDIILSGFVSLFSLAMYVAKGPGFNEIAPLLLSFILTLFCSFTISRFVSKFNDEKKIEETDLIVPIFVGMYSLVQIEKIGFLLLIISIGYMYKINKKRLCLTCIFLLLLWLEYGENYSKYALYAVFASVLLTFLIPETIFKELISVPIYTIFLFAYNRKFYLDQMYYQVVIGWIISYFIPSKIEIKKQVKMMPEIQDYKLEMINDFCTLLEDKRFDKYNDLQYQLVSDIRNTICTTCPRKSECLLLSEEIITSFLDESKKKMITSKCLYPYPVIKKVAMHNQRFYEFNNNQNENLKYKDNLSKSFTLIKEIIDEKKPTKKKEEKYKIEFEFLSIGATKENGDSLEHYKINNQEYVLLSDGMGHEKTSKEISSYLVSLTKILLHNEKNPSQVIKDVNDIMITKTHEELYATLDIAKIDLSSGVLSIYKAGSFSSFMIRKKIVKEFTPLLPPIGIVHSVREKFEEVTLQEGDIIIMMTDGFGEDVERIISSTTQKSSFLSLKNYIKFLYNRFNKAKECKDDKTIIGIKIKCK